ncbi:MAG: cytochrome c oxidase subunit II [Pseudomonadota bacterium]
MRAILTAYATLTLALSAPSAFASEPRDGQLGFQDAATPVMERVIDFHNLLLPIITLISLFVLALLLIVIFKYNRKANPEPQKFSHNTMVEVVWTVVPVLILIVIAIPSFRLLFLTDQVPEADMTIKATGYQWYWGYNYPDHGNFEFVSNMLTDEEAAAAGEPRLLAVDNRIVAPAGATVRVLTTAADVIHAWTIPAFGVKIDAIPGRLNETWFKVDEPGVYYGQCSEICGVKHAFMPIAVEVVPQADFEAWVDGQRALAGLEPMYEEIKVAEAQ